MPAPSLLASLLLQSGLSKSALCRAAGLSRALLDDYLKGRKQPSVAQLDRIAEAAGRRLEISTTPLPTPVPSAFVEVLELGELFPPQPRDPLPDLRHVWKGMARV
ncbi:helix-turn-helix domain-containing protein [Aeromicrobium sp. CF4.19]|uniref:helix-turn-helix domain-containing protein n=1 Tax=Aeromicrobium sp. CF4.19 TaxID=3373082 RepID=UPI003EE75F68